MRFLLCLLSTCILISGNAQDFQKIADSIRRFRGIPGIGYAIFTSDSILEIRVSGYRKFKTRDSVQINDHFHIGTSTFEFTSWLAGRLVESGKIKWTTTFANLYPQYKKKILPQFANVDLKDLLSNQAGIPSYTNLNDFAFVPFFGGDIINQRKEFALWVLQKPGLSEKREKKVVPSIAGYAIAASMLEKVSGMSWEKLVSTYINGPFHADIKFGWPNKISLKQPWGHWTIGNTFNAEPPDTWVKIYPPAAPGVDININLPDYVKFLQQDLKGLRGGKTILSDKTYQILHFSIPAYSLGWENGTIAGQQISSSPGESRLFNSHVELMPGKNIGIIVVCNNGDPNGRAGVLNFSRLIRDYYLSK